MPVSITSFVLNSTDTCRDTATIALTWAATGDVDSYDISISPTLPDFPTNLPSTENSFNFTIPENTTYETIQYTVTLTANGTDASTDEDTQSVNIYGKNTVCTLTDISTDLKNLRNTIIDCPTETNINLGLLNGTIYLNSPIVLDDSNKNVILTGPGKAVLTISAQENSRIFSILDSALFISGVTLKDGRATNGGALNVVDGLFFGSDLKFENNIANNDGGAIYVPSGSIEITNSDFLNNSALGNGGAIYSSGVFSNDATNLTFTNCFADNGGAVYISGNTLTLGNSTFSNNDAVQGSGGAIYIDSASFTLNSSTIQNSSATNDGGSIYASAATVVLDDSSISLSSAAGNGGALYSDGGSLGTDTVTIFSSSATNGGALYATNSSITLISTIIDNNSANIDGGAIWVNESTVTLTSPTPGDTSITNNSADYYGGGIYANSGVSIYFDNLEEIAVSQNTALSGGGIYNNCSNIIQGITTGVINNTPNNIVAGDCTPTTTTTTTTSTTTTTTIPTTTTTSTTTTTTIPTTTTTSTTTTTTIPTTTTTSTTTTTTLTPTKPIDTLGDFIEQLYPKVTLGDNKYALDLPRLGQNSLQFAVVQTSALPTWLDMQTLGIKAEQIDNNTLQVFNFTDTDIGAKLYINNDTVPINIVRNQQVIVYPQTIQNFSIRKTDVLASGSTKEFIVYASTDAQKYSYTIPNAYCDVYEITPASGSATTIAGTRVLKNTLPVFAINNSGQNYSFIVDLGGRSLFDITYPDVPSDYQSSGFDISPYFNENYQIELRFKNPSNNQYVLSGNYTNINKLPVDQLFLGSDFNNLSFFTKNLSSLETITEVLILLAKLRYVNKSPKDNITQQYFQSLLNTVKLLPRVDNLFFSKYSFDESTTNIVIFEDGFGSSEYISLYSNLYMACRFLESKDPDLINFVNSTNLISGIRNCVEFNFTSTNLELNLNNFIREKFLVETINGTRIKSSYNKFFLLKDQILLYILYNYLQEYSLGSQLLDRINLIFASNLGYDTENNIFIMRFVVSESEFEPAYFNLTTLDYIWANYLYTALDVNQVLASSMSVLLQNQQTSNTQLVKNTDNTTLVPNDYEDYNADYDINFSNSPYPKSALTFNRSKEFAYTPYTIINDYLQRKGSYGGFLNNYETDNGVLTANKGYFLHNIFIVPNTFSTVMQILSKISPTDYFAIKTEYLTQILPETQMSVNYYPVTNGVLVSVSLQHSLGVVALTTSPDGNTVYDKKIITTQSNNHTFVLTAPKTSAFILNVNPIIKAI